MVHNLRVACGYVAAGRWVADRGFATSPLVSNRNEVFDSVLALVENEPVTYSEFGVYEGASLRYWSQGLHHPDSQLHGFDSFEGLPENFDSRYGKGHFDVQGKLPVISDDRVTLHIGWFEDVLPSFQLPDSRRLVIALDADLYSSTRFVLEHLSDSIVEGAIIYFDELSRIDHEPAAFDDFMASSGKRFRAIALESNFNTGAFVCLGRWVAP